MSDLFSMKRFEVGKQKHNRRQAELKRFADRMPSLTPQLIAIKMSHLTEDEIAEAYELMSKKAKNFTAYWRWTFMPKKK